MPNIGSAASYKNLVEALQDKRGNNKGILFVKNRENEFFLSYEALYNKALQVLHIFQKKGLEPGDELVFQIEDNYDFVCIFWSCLLGKIIPVPVTLASNDEYLLKLSNIWKILKRPHLITSKKHLANLTANLKEFATLPANTILLEEIETTGEKGVVHMPEESDTAFIQFSSGSTGTPKGVVLTHKNLITNAYDILKSMHCHNYRDTDKMLSWMPLTHDLGIVAYHITPVLGNLEQVLMSPQLFLRFPGFWLKKAAETKSTITCSPNFGYKYVLKHFDPEEYKGLDLSRLRVILNGAEPIGWQLCHEFLDTMAPFGLQRKAMFTAYGLAEASVAVSFADPETEIICATVDRHRLKIGERVQDVGDIKDAISLVQVGYPLERCQIKIAADDGSQLEPNTVGHILVKGDSVTSGYYNNKEATSRILSLEGWLKTGDLGFQRDGGLYITGRAKDVIFVNGQNYYPHDLERIAEEMEGIEFEKIAFCDAFEPVKQINEIIAFLVFKRKIDLEFLTLANNLRQHLVEKVGIEIDKIIPVKQIPKTTSGKIQRYKLKEMYQDGVYDGILQEIETLNEEPGAGEKAIPQRELKEHIARIWEEVLNIKHVGYNDNFFDLGGNSLKAGIAISKIGSQLNINVPLSEFFKKSTINEFVNGIKGFKEKRHSPIERIEEKEYYELSSAQKRMFALHQLIGESTAYNIPILFAMEGEPDVKKMEMAFGELIKRHESLRTFFLIIDDEPVQKIQETVAFAVEFHEEKRRENGEEGTGGETFIRNFIRSFDLSRAPLLRVELVKLEENKHIFLFDMHHIISDGVSIGILIKEFNDCYAGLELKPLTLQYKDYAAWQNHFMKSEMLSKQKKYWQKKFADEIPILAMPNDYTRPIIQSFEGETISFEIDEKLTEELRHLAGNHGCTLYMVLLALFDVLLFKYSGQEDIIVGSSSAGRRHADLEGIIGMFVNTLAMRNAPRSGKSFVDFLTEVKQNSLEALENQDYQFDNLLEHVHLKRDLGRNPLFGTVLALQNFGNEEFEIKGFAFKPHEFENKISKFDITMQMSEGETKLFAHLEYCVKLFKKETMFRFVSHFVNILGEVATNPMITLAKINMLSEAEEKQLLYEFNDTRSDYPQDKTIHQLFAQQVERTPDRIGIVGTRQDAVQMTYSELNKKSNQLAYGLREKGVQPGVMVGLMVKRSLRMVTSILAILKAGGAWLSIDLDGPVERIKYILEDSGVNLIIGGRSVIDPMSGAYTVIEATDSDLTEGDPGPVQNLNCASDAAYIIYTSGTTGKPKGVMVGHRGISNLRVFWGQCLKINENDKILQFAKITFDASVWEIFMTLLHGAALYMIHEAILADQGEFENFLEKKGITVITLPPPYLVYLNPKNITSLRQLITAGSETTLELIEKWIKKVDYINAYGPTETSICATIWRVPGKEKFPYHAVPIGSPISNTQIFILGEDHRLQPLGVPGELYIGGVGLAAGYLNRPELTQEKFVENPHQPGHRIYRSGDWAKWLPDGNIEFLGRIDLQVKIRGFRIELGEIETILLSNESIKEATVVAQKDNEKNNYLAAYYVQNNTNGQQEPISVAQLRNFLSEKLPDYMIPSYFVPLEKLPLTPNGKIDRKAMPEPHETTGVSPIYQPPTNEIEEKLVEIWREVLGLKQIGVTDNFFEIGGQSLKAISIIAKIKKTFLIDLPLSVFFEKTFIKEQARFISNSGTSIFTIVEAVEKKDYYPVSSAQKRMYALNRFAPDSVNYNMPSARLIKGDLSTTHFEESFQTLINRHESFRTSFHLINGEPVQRIHDNIVFSVKRTTDFCLTRFPRPFDLSRVPLLRVELIKLEKNKHIFLLDMHHIISDGVSMAILIKEFSDLYARLELKPLTVQYKDYAAWQSRLLESEKLLKQKKYWQEKFADVIPILAMPNDYTRPTIQSFEGETISFEIDERLTGKLHHLAGNPGCTLYMVLLALFDVLLFKYSGQEDIIVGSSSAGRRHNDLEGIIGMFVNTLAMRNAPRPGKSFVDFLTEVKQNSLDAFENQDYQFDDLLEHLDLKRDLGRNPLFGTVFALQNFGNEEFDIKGFTFKPYEFENKISKFDLGLQFNEGEGKLFAHLEYCVKLFKKETMFRFVSHFMNILGEVAANPMITLAKINMLSEAEEKQLLYEFNDTEASYPKNITLYELFEEQVLKTPGHVALQFENNQLTYDELNKRANRLAWALKGNNFKPGTIVGLMMERSLEMIVGILGILKAGGAYLPIFPALPNSRIQTMIEDTRIQWLLTKEHIFEHFFHFRSVQLRGRKDVPHQVWTRPHRKVEDTGSLPMADIILIDFEKYAFHRVNDEWSQLRCDNLSPMTRADDLSYIIYTSGSTGKPKGVAVTHRNVVNTLLCRKENYEIKTKDSALQLFSYAFDGFVTSFFTPVISGAKVVLLAEEDLKDIEKIKRIVVRNHITHILSVPGLYRAILESLDETELKTLSVVTLAGDILLPGILEQTRNKAGHIEIAHEYGVTEVGVMSTIRRHQQKDNIVTIGKPIWNTGIFIVNKEGGIQPIGVPGEIYISGAGVARGYLNQPELTAQRFVTHPFSKEERIYRTGDLGRWMPDGNIEFIGRLDRQVKIRGYRIELGEIDNHVLRYESIKDVVTAIIEETDGHKSLITYYVENEKKNDQPELWPSVAEFFVYDDLLYYAMTNDELRNERYKIAINHFVKDKVVVDVGTGKDAILARFCAEAGAKKVYALEILDDTYKKAKQTIKKAGLEENIQLIHGDATKIELPEKADVCVQEIVGSIGGSEGVAAILNKAKGLLKANAIMIPEKSITKIAAVRLPDVIHNRPIFSGLPRKYTQKVFDSLGYKFDLRVCIRNFPQENIISNTGNFEDLDFSGLLLEESSDKINFVIDKDDRLDGFLVWLTLHTMRGVVIDILEHEHCWLPIFVPVFYPGINVSKGDKIETTCVRTLCENRINPDFTIKGTLKREGMADIEFDYDLAHFEKNYRRTRFYRRLFDEASTKETEVASKDKSLDVSSLRKFLENRLPDYMIPAHFKKIEKIPLTSNGKVDMKLLESLAVELTTGVEYVPPKDEIEEQITVIWREVLGITKIGTQDNFFEIGGNSLNIVSAKVKMDATLGMDIPVTVLFEHLTIHSLARWVNGIKSGENGATPLIDLSAEIRDMKQNRKNRKAKRGGYLNV